ERAPMPPHPLEDRGRDALDPARVEGRRERSTGRAVEANHPEDARLRLSVQLEVDLHAHAPAGEDRRLDLEVLEQRGEVAAVVGYRIGARIGGRAGGIEAAVVPG